MAKDKPFVFGVATGGNNFTDRENETKRLLANFKYGINTILISPRRIGKTSLVNKVSQLAQEQDVIVANIDVFSCRCEADFINAFSSAIVKATSSKLDDILSNIKLFFSRFSPKISFGDDPLNEFSLSLDYDNDKHLLEDVLGLPERIAKERNKQFVVCIDEFQQIGEFSDSITFQKRLRSVWQHQENVAYCLYGSKKHLMSALFLTREKPFYKFGETIFLGKIPVEEWIPYIRRQFAIENKCVSEHIVSKLCSYVDNHSSYVQHLAWLLWLETENEASEADLDVALNNLINECSPLFVQQTESLTTYQLNFLYSLTHGVNNGHTKSEVLKKYNLGTGANIVRIKKSLTDKELIDFDEKGDVVISDPVMQIWLKRLCPLR